MEIFQFAQYVLLAAVIAGVTELLKRLRARDYWTALTIGTAAAIGGLFGLCGVEGLSFVQGVAAGFGTSGSLTALGIVGKKSDSVPSTAVTR